MPRRCCNEALTSSRASPWERPTSPSAEWRRRDGSEEKTGEVGPVFVQLWVVKRRGEKRGIDGGGFRIPRRPTSPVQVCHLVQLAISKHKILGTRRAHARLQMSLECLQPVLQQCSQRSLCLKVWQNPKGMCFWKTSQIVSGLLDGLLITFVLTSSE